MDIRLLVLVELIGDPAPLDGGLGAVVAGLLFACCSSLSLSLRGACMLFIGTFEG